MANTIELKQQIAQGVYDDAFRKLYGSDEKIGQAGRLMPKQRKPSARTISDKHIKGGFAMKQGVLVYDRENDRIDIRFGLEDYYGGLHCGTSFDVLIGRRWIPTRIELGRVWYLVGIKTSNLEGLRVRI